MLRKEEAKMARKKKNESFIVSLFLPDVAIHVDVPATMIGDEAIAYVVDVALQQSAVAQESGIRAEDYMLKVEGVDYFVTQTHLELHRVRIMQVCAKTFVVPRLQLVERSEENVELAKSQESAQKELEVAEIVLQSDLDALIPNLAEYLQLDNRDITAYRAKMTVERANFTKELSTQIQEEATYMLHKYVDSEPMPLRVPPSISININLPLQEKATRGLQASANSSVDELIVAAFRKFQAFSKAAEGKKPEDYILKVTGYQDFLFGPEPIIYYDYIRRCLSKEQDIVLSLVETNEIVKQYPKEQIGYISIVDKVLAVPEVEDTSLKVVSVNKKNVGLKLKVKRVEGVRMNTATGSDVSYFVCMKLINGNETLIEPQFTKLSPCSSDGNVIWDQVMFTSITIPNIPLGVRLQFAVYARTRPEGAAGSSEASSVDPTTDQCIAWINFALFNSAGFMKTGLQAASLWSGDKCIPDPVGSCMQNLCAKDPMSIFIDFEPTMYFKNPKFRSRLSEAPIAKMNKGAAKLDAGGVMQSLENVIKKDSLMHLTEEEMMLLWDNRNLLVNDPRALPKVALSCPWTDDKAVRDLYELIRFWAPLSASQAIELVGFKFSDPIIRAHGVEQLDKLSDAEILAFLPQLVQALKFELNHDSALATLLIQRAFRNRHRIGHAFFWALKSEMHLPSIAERYGLMLESYLRGCGTHRKELLTQVKVMDQLVEVALKVKKIPKETRKEVLQETLKGLKLPNVFQLPLDPRYQVNGLKIEKCKTMDSKKVRNSETTDERIFFHRNTFPENIGSSLACFPER